MTAREVDAIYGILSRRYPVFADSDDEWMTNGLSATPFRSLVSVALSTMTQSTRCIRACVALYDEVSTFAELAALDDDRLRELIKPVAHYNRKTRSLKAMARAILDHHHGEIPHTREELMALPGIGRKCADIMLNFTYGQDTIAVDTHVHRVANRLGLVDTTTHTATADALTAITAP